MEFLPPPQRNDKYQTFKEQTLCDKSICKIFSKNNGIDEYEILVFPLVAQESQVTEIYRTSTLTNKPQNMGLHCYVTYREVHILNCRIT